MFAFECEFRLILVRPVHPLNKLSGWCRAALVFSIVWIACVIALVLYEKYVTIGSRADKYAALFDYNTLIFYGIYRMAQRFRSGFSCKGFGQLCCFLSASLGRPLPYFMQPHGFAEAPDDIRGTRDATTFAVT